MKYYLQILLILVPAILLSSEWELDYYLKVENKNSKVIKYDDIYNIIDNKDSTIRLIRLDNEEIDTIVLDSYYNDYLHGFEINSEYIILNGFKGYYYFNYQGNKSKKRIDKSNVPSQYLDLINEELYSYSSNLSTASCKNKTKTLLQIIKIENQIQELYTFPDPVGIDLSNFSPSKAIAIFNNLIAVQDISTYSVKFYDLDYNYVDSIVYQPTDWKQYTGKIPHYECNPEIMDHFDKCWEIIDNYSRINLINTLNDSTVLITWGMLDKNKEERKFKFYHDKWTKINGNWEVEKEITFEINKLNDIFDLSKIDVKAEYFVKHGYLYIIKPFPIDLVKKYYGKSFSEFENAMNEFYIDNELQYTCFIYKYVP